MRSIRFTAAMALAIVMTLGFAPSAFAQEAEDHGDEVITDEDNGTGEEDHGAAEDIIHAAHEYLEEQGAHHADIECIDIIVEGGSVEDCRDAPNPLLPETNEILWGALGFTVVFLFLAKFGYPAMRKSMDERSEKIRADLDAAETAKTAAEGEKANYLASLGDAKGEAARIIEEARQQADALKADAQTRLNDELATSRAQAQADIDAAKGQAMAELRGEVASIAIGAAETVVQANLDQASQTRLVEDYITRVQSGQN